MQTREKKITLPCSLLRWGAIHVAFGQDPTLEEWLLACILQGTWK